MPQGHPARLVWDYVSSAEVASEIIKTTGAHASSVPLFAVWLYAGSKGVGSAAELAWLCQHNLAFKWLSGGRAIDANGLAAFRSVEPQAGDDLLAQSLVALRRPGANAGDAATGGEAHLLALVAGALRHVTALRQKLSDPLGERLRRRQQAADSRRATRASRVDSARAELARLTAARQDEAKRIAEAKRLAEQRLAEQRLAEQRQAEQRLAEARAAEARQSAEQALPGSRQTARTRPAAGPRRYVAMTSLAWGVSDNEEGRFRRVLSGTLVVFFALSAALMLIKPPPVERQKDEKIPQRLTQLFEEQKVKPKLEKPKLEETIKPKDLTPKDIKPSEPTNETKVATRTDTKQIIGSAANKNEKPTTEQVAEARERASKSGLVAMKEQFTALRSLGTGDAFRQDQQLVAGTGGTGGGSGAGVGAGKGVVERDLIGRAATSGSGGIAGKSVNYAGGGSLGGRTTTEVKGPAGTPTIAQVEADAKKSGKRSAEDIRLAFDANKSAIYGIYRRALRQNPLLEGRVVLKLTIDKSGRVTACTIASSALKDADLEEKLVARVMLIEFGARPNAETWTGTYQIDFSPSS